MDDYSEIRYLKLSFSQLSVDTSNLSISVTVNMLPISMRVKNINKVQLYNVETKR